LIDFSTIRVETNLSNACCPNLSWLIFISVDRGVCRGPLMLKCRTMLARLVVQTLGSRTRRRGRPNHGLTGFVVPRCPTFLLGNPLLTAPQESVGGLGCPLDQIRCRQSQLNCSLIHPQRQSSHHIYRRQKP